MSDHKKMMSEADTLELLEVEVADAVSQCHIDPDLYEQALNRIHYRFSQCQPVKPKRHKGKYVNDFFTCGNCSASIPEAAWDYCPKCGYMILKGGA